MHTNCDYWLASPYPDSDQYIRVMYLREDGLFNSGGYRSGSNYGHRHGLRPVITLSDSVFIKKNEVTKRWEIHNIVD